MSLQVNLQVTATVGGHDPNSPVHVGYDGTRAVLLADARHTEALARIIARGIDRSDDPDIDKQFWTNVLGQLFAAKGEITPRPVPAFATPLEVVR